MNSARARELQVAVDGALKDVAAGRYELSAESSDEAWTLTVRPTTADAAPMTITLFGEEAVIEIASRVTVETPMRTGADREYIASIAASVARGLRITQFGSEEAPFLTRTAIPLPGSTLQLTTVELRRIFSLPRRTEFFLVPY